MPYESYHAAVLDAAWLAACAVKETAPDIERVRQMDLTELYKAADRHMMTGITAMALESAGIRDEAFTQAKGKAIRKAAAFDVERSMVLDALEQEGIWYMPLKGAVIKSLYPKLGMRQMSDNDILIDSDRIQDTGRIMEKLGFIHSQRGAVDDIWLKEPVCNFEMHRALFHREPYEDLYNYYRDVKKRLIKDGQNRYGYHFSDEDFYVYMIAHEYTHYCSNGTGLRSLLDIWVYCRHKGSHMDWDYIAGELQKMGIGEFELQNRDLALRLFEGEALTKSDEEMLDYIVSSGTYGNRGNLVSNRIRQYGGGRLGKAKYIISRIFPPMYKIEISYPFFYRHRILLPVLVIYRIGKSLTVRRKVAKTELKALFGRKD